MTEPEQPPRDLPTIVKALVIVSVAVNVLLAVAIGVLAAVGLHRIDTTETDNVNRIHASQLQSCAQGNTVRARDIAIWNRLLTLSPAQQAQQDAAARAEVRRLEYLVKVKDTPVNCSRLYPPPRG